ncbi:MAG: protoporphyrinogen oxidase [Longimicrobiales bacterium]|nr:protoporphyrinogen oxidase [Longimicrobiales bacterium]
MIGVVGAGITGLTLAHELRRRGRTVRVWEAAERPGGVMWSEKEGGRVLDFGPQRTRLTRDVKGLVDELGLGERLLYAPEGLPLYVYRSGRLRPVPFSLGQALRTDLLSWRAKLRALAEPFIVPRRAGESVEELFVRNFGREIYENLLGPLYGGLYASDPGRMPARHALARVLDELKVGPSLLLAFLRRGAAAREAIPTITFEEGLGALPRALAESLGDALLLGTPVDQLAPGPMGRIQVEAGGTVQEVQAVVLTCPASAAGHILRQAAPMASESLESLTYNPLAVVHLESDCQLEGFGYQVAFGETLETRGVTWNDSIFGREGEHGRRGLYTAYLGGMKNPGLVQEDDDRIGEIAAREFEEVTGCPAGIIRVSRTRVPAWDESWDVLDRISVPRGVHLCASYTGRPGIPGRVAVARRLAAAL